MDRPTLLLAGPTASGKSALALRLARRLGGVVINADAMQVYRDLRVLTARPSPADEAAAPHRLYGHVDGAEVYTAARWAEAAAAEVARAREAGLLPIVTGGTGLYFRALLSGFSPVPTVPGAVRAAVRAAAEGRATPDLHADLAALDPTTAAGLRPNDRQRLLRALEVLEGTGRGLRAWQAEPPPGPLIAGRSFGIFLAPTREVLGARIAARLEGMVAAGALDEVDALVRRGIPGDRPIMRAHGMPWFARHLTGEVTLEAAITGTSADTRAYVKRQFTWFRHQAESWTWLEPEVVEDAVLGHLGK